MTSSDEYEPSPLKPQTRRGRKPEGNTGARITQSLSGIIANRQEVVNKLKELELDKNQHSSTKAMINAAKMLNKQRWTRYVVVIRRPIHEHEDSYSNGESGAGGEYYTFSRMEVVSKILDFVDLHIQIMKETGKIKYKTSWAYSEVVERIDTRIKDFAKMLTERASKLKCSRDIYTFKQTGGKEAQRWIEMFQIEDARLYEEDEGTSLDYHMY